MAEAAPKTDAQIIAEVNGVARLMLAYLGVGFTAPVGFKFYEAGERDWRARQAWDRAVEVYEWITGTEVHDALIAVREDGETPVEPSETLSTPAMRQAADAARTAHLRDVDANDQIGALNAALEAALAVRGAPHG